MLSLNFLGAKVILFESLQLEPKTYSTSPLKFYDTRDHWPTSTLHPLDFVTPDLKSWLL